MGPALSHRDVKVVLATAFPGITITVQDRLGGSVCRAVIWHFHIEASISALSLSIQDVVGLARCTLTLRPPSGKQVVIHRAECRDTDELRVFVQWVQSYMDGIIAAITIACEGSGPVDIMGNGVD